MRKQPEIYGPRTFPRQPRLMLSGFDFHERVQAAQPLDVTARVLRGDERESFEMDEWAPAEPVIERGAAGTVLREVDHPVWGRCIVVHFDPSPERSALYVYMPPDALVSAEQGRAQP